MIDWMQRHKKYLIVTIWISTIAFVGAGFVGWGDYQLSSNASKIAKVGDEVIQASELQEEYSQLFAQLSRQNPNFDEEMAKQMNLEQMALDRMINRKYLMNFANELGLYITDQEVADNVLQTEAFKIDGEFSRETYTQILNINALTPKLYEDKVRQNLMFEKILDVMELRLTPLEQEISDLTTKLEDRISIKVIDASDFEIEISEEDLKKFWEGSKERYQTQKTFELAFEQIDIAQDAPSEKDLKAFYEEHKTKITDDEGAIKSFDDAKDEVIALLNEDLAIKAANQAFYDLKNQSKAPSKTLSADRFGPLGGEAFAQIGTYKAGEFFKPIKYGDAYIVGQVKAINEPQVKTYEQAKASARYFLDGQLRREQLEKTAKSQVATFVGKDAGFVSKATVQDALEGFGLDAYEKNRLVFTLMQSTDDRGFAIADLKAILFEVTDQRVPGLDEPLVLNSLDELKSITQNDDGFLEIKKSLVSQMSIKYFKERYPVEVYVDTLQAN